MSTAWQTFKEKMQNTDVPEDNVFNTVTLVTVELILYYIIISLIICCIRA